MFVRKNMNDHTSRGVMFSKANTYPPKFVNNGQILNFEFIVSQFICNQSTSMKGIASILLDSIVSYFMFIYRVLA